jgi:hypothetical protein
MSTALSCASRPDATQQLRQVLAVDILHGHEMRAFEIDDVVDAADVRMRDLPAEAHFIVQASEEDRIACQTCGGAGWRSHCSSR